MGKFRFQSQYIHLTYGTHINVGKLRSFLRKKSDHCCKIAHESGDEHHNYLHTHCLCYFVRHIDTRNERYFDFDGIHPHIRKINDSNHWNTLLKYLDKENCVHNSLTGDEYRRNTGFKKNLMELIQKHSSWKCVLNDVTISNDIKRIMTWAKQVYDNKNIVNLTKDIELYDWQLDVVKRVATQNDRKILWVLDEKGGKGKSVLTNWFIDNKNAFMCNGGKLNDIAYAYDNQKIVIFDLPRCIEDFTPYRAMECFKDGRLFSAKYQSCIKRFIPPAVIVFANFEPVYEKLSVDRWDVLDLSDDMNIINRLTSWGGL